MEEQDIDIAILGGGLAGGLIALALAKSRPEMRLAIFEQGARFGGNHVWSFFASDVDPAGRALLEPLIAARWDRYDVHFPGHSRELTTPYRSITSEKLDSALRKTLPETSLHNNVEIASANQTGLTLADGREIKASAVIDARGAAAFPHMAGGWQKFLGQMLRLERPHGLDRPVVMDARVEQLDGYRFVYCLPFSERELFVEDTYYSLSPELDPPVLRQRIAAYAEAQDWQIADISREEAGVLPVIGAGDFGKFWPPSDSTPARAGTKAALIHPLTSYSLPDAVRFANHLAGLENLSGAALAKASYEWSLVHWRQGRFYRMLTKMLFSAAQPSQRYRILERFYRLPEGLIERFYSGLSTRGDCVRILAGKPPVPIGAALAALTGRGAGLSALGGST